MTRALHSLIHYLRHSLAHRGDAALSDAQLLERWVEQHDPAAFELMLWRHGPMVLNTCRRLLPKREDAEDAFQATFLVLVRKASSIRRREALAAWLHRVACRIAGRLRATNNVRSSREQPFADSLAAPHVDAPAARDLHAILDEEIESLPAHYRRALILCCLEGKLQEEAARLLDRPRGTVSSWLTRGRERLRQRLLRRGIVVSITGLTAALTPDALSAGGMIPLIGSLVRMAGAVAAGDAFPTGLMSARTIALAEGVLRMMFMTKLKIVVAISLVVAVATAGIGTWSHTTRAADDPPVSQQPAKGPQTNAPNPFKLYKELNAEWVRRLEIKEQDGIAWGEKAHGLQAGIAFRRGDQESYEIGQSVTFVVYLRNVSDKKIDLSHIEPLFDEWLPVVVDAEGRRLAVSHGPIQLGMVPITHRSLEAGQRITLGYPWFRIRPLGWRGEVRGPTCCAAPGRYKVGFTGLPHDKGELRSRLQGFMRRLLHLPEHVMNYFCHPSVQYATAMN
jgi:RNA polymerase sigma factor (sigma-70 family)